MIQIGADGTGDDQKDTPKAAPEAAARPEKEQEQPVPEEVREAQPAQELPDRPAGGEPQILQEPVPMDLEEEPAEEQEDVVRTMARIMETQPV